MIRAALVAVGLVGCSTAVPDEVPEEDIGRWASAVSCERSQECARADFELAYYDAEDCRATEELAWTVLSETLSDCDYDPTRAANRLEEVQAMSCEEWYEGDAAEAFSEIWDDCPLFPGF